MTENVNRKRVLVVDDESSVRRVIYEILRKKYDVLQAQNGEEAVCLARIQKPDVIVMDMIMPMMDGITACSEIRKEGSTAKIPVIMLTAVDHYLNRNLAESVGITAYLTKPFGQHDLLSTLNGLLEDSPQMPVAICKTLLDNQARTNIQ